MFLEPNACLHALLYNTSVFNVGDTECCAEIPISLDSSASAEDSVDDQVMPSYAEKALYTGIAPICYPYDAFLISDSEGYLSVWR